MLIDSSFVVESEGTVDHFDEGNEFQHLARKFEDQFRTIG